MVSVTEYVVPEEMVQVASCGEAQEILKSFPSERMETTLERVQILEDGQVEIEGKPFPW